MGDRTYGGLVVYACPDDQLAALCDAIRDDGLTTYADGRPGLVLGAPGYFHEEVSVGWMHDSELAPQLIKVAPGASWKAWEAPRYEYLGTVVMYTPELGRFQADCDAEGDVVADYRTLRHKIDKEGLTYAEALGVPWDDAFKALQDAMPDGLAGKGHVVSVPVGDAVSDAGPAAATVPPTSDSADRLRPRIWSPLDYTGAADPDRQGRVDFDDLLDPDDRTIVTVHTEADGDGYRVVVRKLFDDDQVTVEMVDAADANPVQNVARRGRTLSGTTLGVPADGPKIEEIAKVYLLWDDRDGRWVVDEVTLQDCPLDGLETGPYLNGGDPDDPTTREAFNRAGLADLPDAHGVLVMLAEALGYRVEVTVRKDG